MKTKRHIEVLYNTFHNTSVRVLTSYPKDVGPHYDDDGNYHDDTGECRGVTRQRLEDEAFLESDLSGPAHRRLRRVLRALCGIVGCCCGDGL